MIKGFTGSEAPRVNSYTWVLTWTCWSFAILLSEALATWLPGRKGFSMRFWKGEICTEQEVWIRGVGAGLVRLVFVHPALKQLLAGAEV